MQEGGKQSDHRNDKAYRKGLDSKDDKDWFVHAWGDDTKSKLLGCLCDQEKDQAEHNHILDPHFPDGKRKYLFGKSAHVQGNGVAGHGKYHKENHDQCKNNALKFCFWHNKPSS